MDSVTVIRIFSGVLFVVVLSVLFWRRKKTA
jgi:LPXTG-motif cell wall-anchored protein